MQKISVTKQLNMAKNNVVNALHVEDTNDLVEIIKDAINHLESAISATTHNEREVQ